MIQDEISIFIFLVILLALIYYVAHLPYKWAQFIFKAVPTLLFCYFLPSAFVSLGVIDVSHSDLNGSLSKILLPFCIFYFSLGLPISQLKKLGKMSLLIFFAGSIGVILGGPISLWISHFFFPDSFTAESYKGMATIAGSWIGGTANQMALNAIFNPSADELAKAVTVDVFFGETWLAILLILIPFQSKINHYFKAKDDSQFLDLDWEEHNTHKSFTFINLLYMLGLGFSVTQIAQLVATFLVQMGANGPIFQFLNKSFWVFLFSTIFGILLGLTKLRKLYGEGGDVISTLFLYFIIASIGLKISISHLFSTPILLFTGFIWIAMHGLAIFVVGKWLKAPYHYMAIASQANVGGIASTSIVATAFSPRLTPMGIILALLGYAVGTYGGYLSAILMKWISVTY
jgi:uncharacterized membrane protein